MNAVVQSSKGGAVHNSLSPGQVTAVTPSTGSSSSEILRLLSYRDATTDFEMCFPQTFRWIKLSCCQISRVQHRGSAAKLIEGQEKTPWISAGRRSSLLAGAQQIVYPGSPCCEEQHRSPLTEAKRFRISQSHRQTMFLLGLLSGPVFGARYFGLFSEEYSPEGLPACQEHYSCRAFQIAMEFLQIWACEGQIQI